MRGMQDGERALRGPCGLLYGKASPSSTCLAEYKDRNRPKLKLKLDEHPSPRLVQACFKMALHEVVWHPIKARPGLRLCVSDV